MSDLPKHPIRLDVYPSDLLNKSTRELLYLSQTNVTPEAADGYHYAVAAYDRAHLESPLEDPTAAGEAAAKAGFRAMQAKLSGQAVHFWFERAGQLLGGVDSERFRREYAAAKLLEGRAYTLQLLEGETTLPDYAKEHVHKSFLTAEMILANQHRRGQAWDPYATMQSQHYGAFQAMYLTGRAAALTGFNGIWQALRSKQEHVNEFREPRRLEHLRNHARFVAKHVVANQVVMVLGATAPLKRFDRIAIARHHAARRLVR